MLMFVWRLVLEEEWRCLYMISPLLHSLQIRQISSSDSNKAFKMTMSDVQ